MGAHSKLAIVFASGLAIGLYLLGSRGLENVVELARLERIDVLINEARKFVRPQAAAFAVDPAAARRIDEDLDYLTAKRIGSLEGWRVFLARYGSGGHAQSAKSEIDKLLLSAKAPQPAAAKSTNGMSPDARAESEPAPPSPLSLSAEIVAPRGDAVRDELEPPPGGATTDEVVGFTREWGDGKVQPQPASLMDRLTAAPEPAPTAKTANVSAKVVPDVRSKPRATHSTQRTALASPSSRSRQHARSCAFRFECHWRALTPPLILLALLGERPKHSRAFGQRVADARLTNIRGR